MSQFELLVQICQDPNWVTSILALNNSSDIKNHNKLQKLKRFHPHTALKVEWFEHKIWNTKHRIHLLHFRLTSAAQGAMRISDWSLTYQPCKVLRALNGKEDDGQGQMCRWRRQEPDAEQPRQRQAVVCHRQAGTLSLCSSSRLTSSLFTSFPVRIASHQGQCLESTSLLTEWKQLITQRRGWLDRIWRRKWFGVNRSRVTTCSSFLRYNWVEVVFSGADQRSGPHISRTLAGQRFISHIHKWWEVTKYSYFINVLMWGFQLLINGHLEPGKTARDSLSSFSWSSV